ncbi:MAG: hypothetical protein ACSW8G_02785 [Bacillota bacterium]
MIAAEQWYEYQRQYQRYGLDMRPEEESISQRERRRQEREAAKARGTVLRLGANHRIMFSIVIAVAVVFMMVVIIVSYGAKVTYDINTIKAENDVISGEIEDLDVKMLSSNTVIYIESQAKEKLGMKNPDNKHCVYLSSSETPEKGFADMLKAKAYN